MIQLGRNPECTGCDLHEDCKFRCVPTTLYNPVKKHDRALLIVGEAPGGKEDKKGEPFVGPAGLTLRRLYIDFFHLDDKADIYLGNAVRCRPPGNRTPNKTQLKSCHGFLLADVIRLQREYKEVLVLAVGGPASQAIMGCGAREAFRRQGEFTDWHNLLKWGDKPTDFETQALEVWGAGIPEPTRVFTTWHPSYLNREPTAGMATKRHLQMLSDYLDGKLEYELPELLEIAVAPMPPKYPLRRLSLDIETYGFVKGYPKQRYFHPRKSHVMDHIDPKHMVQTVALTWYGPPTFGEGDYVVEATVALGGFSQLNHAIFHMDKVDHRRRLWAWLRKIKREEGFEYLIGQNFPFDLMYLRYCYEEARYLLDDPLPIMDLMVLNYLHDESRPEKSLKALAPLFRVTKYKEGGKKVKRYDSNKNPEFNQYNCQDTAATLRTAEKLEAEIRSFYGQDTKKLSPFCMQWYSQLLWLIVWMSEEGIQMDEAQLRTLFDRYEGALHAIIKTGRERFDLPLRGKGSDTAKRALMDEAADALEEAGIVLPDVEKTKGGKTKISVENRNAYMDLMPHEWPTYKALKLFGSYQDVSGVMDRYLYPLLVGGGKDHKDRSSVLLGGFCYPRWYPVPGEFEGQSGGTKQARIVAKMPPCQTFPPSIKKTIQGRFPNGWMIWFDYSQIELRVAALLSGDPAMMEEYMGRPDLHGATARLMFGEDIVNHPQYKALYRQAGKTFNFRALYRGGARKAQQALMQDLGIHLDLSRIAQIDEAFWHRHSFLRAWQDDLFQFVLQRGYYELPLIGQSRLFLGGKKAKERKINEIVNLPVQAIAADIMLSAQYHLWARMRQENLKAVVPCNIYDAALIECPKYEIYRVRNIMKEVLPNPPFYAALCEELGRTLPLEYDVEEKRIAA